MSASHSSAEASEWAAVLKGVRGTALDAVFLSLYLDTNGALMGYKLILMGDEFAPAVHK